MFATALVAVDGALNQAKGDGDTATWLPPNPAFRCEYVARQVAVKRAYELWATQAERDAMLPRPEHLPGPADSREVTAFLDGGEGWSSGRGCGKSSSAE